MIARTCVWNFVILLIIFTNQAFSQDALSIIKKADEKMRGTTAKVEMTKNHVHRKRSSNLRYGQRALIIPWC